MLPVRRVSTPVAVLVSLYVTWIHRVVRLTDDFINRLERFVLCVKVPMSDEKEMANVKSVVSCLLWKTQVTDFNEQRPKNATRFFTSSRCS